MRGRRNFISATIVAIGFLLRLRAVPPDFADVDGVNFARALSSFDPLNQSPHLPGYPVYVLLAKLFAFFDLADVWALALPSLLLFPAGALLLQRGVERRFGEQHGWGALLFASFAPPAVMFGGWPTSDGFGFSLLCAAIGLLFLERSLLAGILFGMLLGVRLSWWPLVISAVLLTDRRRRFATGAAAAAAIWIGALFFFASPLALLEGTLAFGRGHFTSWGVTPDFALLGRVLLAAALIAVAFVLPRALAIALLPYALWIVLAQNLTHVRHFLPLVPIAGFLAWRFKAPLAAASLIASLSLAHQQGTELSPAAAIAHRLRARSPERLQVFAGESARVIQHSAPAVRVWRPADAVILQREALAAHRRGAEVFIVSDAPGVEPSDRLMLRPFAPEEIHALR